ncbi:MAG: cytochrome P450 [Actinomycetota bacterium]
MSRPQSIDEVDVFAADTIEDWYPTYDLLRQECPVYRVPGTDTYFVTRYDDIITVLRQTDVYRRGDGGTRPLLRDPQAAAYYAEHGWPKRLPLGIDPPKHRRYREMVDHFFNVAGAEQQRPLIEAIVDRLIDDMAHAAGTGRPVDFLDAFAVPLPVEVITTMIGFPLADIEQLKRWSEAWVAPFSLQLDAEQEREVARLNVEFQHYIAEHIAQRRVAPTDDVISYLVTTPVRLANGDRPLRDDEIINMIDHLYIGGNETTTFALASGMWLLIEHPQLQATLRADPMKIPAWVDEVLRLESPTQGMDRHTAVDAELGGVTIPQGSHVHIRYAAANRDADQFECPADVDLDRSNGSRHLAFSLGETHCPGAGLSRLEQVIATTALLDRFDNLAFADGANDFHHAVNFTLRAFDALQITFDDRRPPPTNPQSGAAGPDRPTPR